MACSAEREGRHCDERGVSGLLAKRDGSARQSASNSFIVPVLAVVVKEVIRGWLVTRVGIWLIAPFLLVGVGWWLDSLLLTGFRAAVLVALVVAWFVDFEFGRSRQREYVANLGCSRLITIGLTLGMALCIEVAFSWFVSAL